MPAEIRLLKDFESDFAKMQEMFDNAMVESIENSHGEKAVNGSGEVKFTFEQRKNIRPDIDRTDVVFTDGGVSYSISFEPISSESKNNAISRGDNVLEDESSIIDAIDNSLSNRNVKENYIIGSIPNSVKNRIVSNTKSNPFKDGEYVLKISSDDIRHIEKHFNDTNEILRAIYRLYDVICNYDNIEQITMKDGQIRLKFEKSYDDYDYLSITITSKKSRCLDLVSFYITKNNKKVENKIQSPADKSAAQGVSSSTNNNIPESYENVNSKFTNSAQLSADVDDNAYYDRVKDVDRSNKKLYNDNRGETYAKKFFGYDEKLTKKIQTAESRRFTNTPFNQQSVSKTTIPQNDTDVNTYSMQNSENNSHSDNFSADDDSAEVKKLKLEKSLLKIIKKENKEDYHQNIFVFLIISSFQSQSNEQHRV